MTVIPDYVNCQNEKIEVCAWYCHKDCQETCAYALDVIGRANEGTLEKQVWEDE
jgi:hypothetical protein